MNGPDGTDGARKSRAPARLKKRADFLAAAKGRRWRMPAFTLQAAPRAEPDVGEPRFGFTVTRKTGHSVERNRMRRRLREALRLAADLPARAGHDYVLVVQRDALTRSFADLGADLNEAVRRIHAPRGDKQGRR